MFGKANNVLLKFKFDAWQNLSFLIKQNKTCYDAAHGTRTHPSRVTVLLTQSSGPQSHLTRSEYVICFEYIPMTKFV